MSGSAPIRSDEDGELLARFWRLVNGLPAYFAVLAADELGVFEALVEGPASPHALAARCGADPSRLTALLLGNVAAGTLLTEGGNFSLTALAAAHLVPSRQGYLGPLLRQSPGPFENWPALASTVAGAEPPREVTREPGRFLLTLVEATFPLQLAVARAVVGRELSDLPEAATVVELGAGCAPWTVAVLESFPRARAVVNDLPGVIDAATRELAARGLADRVTFVEGSYWSVELPQGGADVAVLGHVCRAEGDEGAASLVRRAAGTLREGGGSLVVTEYLLDDDLAGPAQAQLLGTTMVASTRHGATFTHRQAHAWLEEAGLRLVAEVSPVPPTTVLVATGGSK